MTTGIRRVRAADTTEGIAQAFIEAAKGLPNIPAHISLRKKDIPFWEAVVANKSRDEWTEVQLVAAAQLARTQCDIHEWSLELERQPAVIVSGPHDTPKANPLIGMIEAATRRQLSLFRALGIANTEDRGDIGKRQSVLRAAREVRKAVTDNPLIAS